jgi:hypothetical protein
MRLILLSHKAIHFQKTLKTVYQNINKVCVTLRSPPPPLRMSRIVTYDLNNPLYPNVIASKMQQKHS